MQTAGRNVSSDLPVLLFFGLVKIMRWNKIWEISNRSKTRSAAGEHQNSE